MQLRRTLCCFILLLASVPLFAQQTGSISGRVTTEGVGLPGVTVEASSNVLPQPRVTVTDANGEYRLPALQPGMYTVTYSLSGMQTVTRRAAVQLSQNTIADVTLGVEAMAETITVTAEATLVDRTSTEINTGISENEIEALPVTQNYGDLQKLIPGVMYTQDQFRGPSAGASGQENVYQFDGANVTMPLFGILNIQPNTRDIAQVTIVKGGATATEFNRAGGFLIDTVSKSGTNELAGELGFQILNSDFIAEQVGAANLAYAEDRTWTNFNIGGPILQNQLFFYGSYYRPDFSRSNQGNLYGDLPEYSRERDEYFGKLTYTPTSSLLLNGTYRDSHDVESSGGAFTSLQAPTTGTGSQTRLRLGTLEASWVISPKSFAEFKFNDYANPGGGTSDFISNAQVSTALGTQLNLADLASQGRLILPLPLGNNTAQNEFIAPFINQYGYICPQNPEALGLTCVAGQRTGGGTVGFGQFAQDDDSFYRKTLQAAFNYTLGSTLTHDLHIGYRNTLDEEDRFQTSNGWGSITIPAGVAPAGVCPASACGSATPAFFVASFPQQTTGAVPTIHSEVRSQNIELNDSIRYNNWTFNVGLLASNDILYGQGLKEADNVAGFERSPGTQYKMHEFGWDEMLQPRLGATWAYNGNDTVWASYARYHPQANSDARAASWDRSLAATINAYFDAQGKLIGVAPNAGSFGKWWQEGIKPPKIDEFMLGTGREITRRWSARAYGRFREGSDYIEDTNNTARTDPTYGAPDDIPNELYVPNLSEIVAAIGSGSSYVIANLDGAFTRYLEATVENEWRGDALVLNGSYTWSHYYGNFDQDNTTFNTANDTSVFIGSSNIGDSQGRQLWNFKYGDLRGDRRHVVKTRATYQLPWRATAGVFGVWQSGQPYQLESVLPYRGVTTSTSDTNRYAEPAGRRRSPSYYNVDFNYTQNIPLIRSLNLQLALDVFNLTNNQEGYNYETRIGALSFTNDLSKDTVPIPESISDQTLKALLSPNAPFNRNEWAVNAPFAKSFYAPRRYQIAARIQF